MKHPIEAVAVQEKKTIGFWMYLMTDLILFASLFATFAVLRGQTAGGPSGSDIFNMPFVLLETMILLSSSFTVGLAVLGSRRGYKKQTICWLVVTFVLGATFLTLELTEFTRLVAEGYSWQRSAFLSAFFTLVGTHGLHIAVGLLWLVVLIVRLIKFRFRQSDIHRLALFGLFWHFLDVVWIFIFSIVYLIGGLT
ncbi:MAG: cytochrome o ubiquinol oxidase subunit III [Candidatus Microsaccharimonas sossegonensis]|uniref:Cytochrome bo(3) ubiquinol oxidase subunit 3 n=1 Tax=Candidatus Microsaccharimonas sossegonensis TaxID=2506948 RepID=A0A4Q0AI70_9BACT|nr:MAG: cytochrome o ubiquinol oxidase subunit III [Candidatus Microsaccharimonas sossegonensis]